MPAAPRKGKGRLMPPRKKQVTYSRRPNHAARSVHARGEREFRKYDTSYIRPKKSIVPVVLTIVLAVVVIGGLCFGGYTLYNFLKDPEVELLAEGQEATITVAEGSGASTIAEQLFAAKLIESESAFTSRVNELNVASQLKPGTYIFVGGTSLDDVISTLEAGPVMGDALTIPEGYTLAAIASSVESFTEGRILAVDFQAAASNASVYAADYPFLAEVGAASLEGFLFPKTYTIPDDATADSIIRIMLTQFQTEIATLDLAYPTSQGLSLYDTVKLASIVEKESTGDQEIRAKVASVFYNRLATTGEPSYGFLQSDATTAYEVGQDPTAEQVQANTPYSTYTNKGLPPTPICSPGLDSLSAVCYPDQVTLGTAFYFLFSVDGEYRFSETYEQHMQAIDELL